MSLIRLLDPCTPCTRPLIHTDGHTLTHADIKAYRHMGGNTGRYQGSQADSAGKTSITRRGPVWKTCKAPRGKTNRTSQPYTHTHTERERERETNRPKATNTQTDTQTERQKGQQCLTSFHITTSCVYVRMCVCVYVSMCVCMYVHKSDTYVPYAQIHLTHTVIHTYIQTMRTHTHTQYIHSSRQAYEGSSVVVAVSR